MSNWEKQARLFSAGELKAVFKSYEREGYVLNYQGEWLKKEDCKGAKRQSYKRFINKRYSSESI